MKNLRLIIAMMLIGILSVYSQSSSSNNTPTGVNHLGWDDTGNTQLRITQNNTNRMLFNSLQPWNGLFGAFGANANRVTLPYNNAFGESVVGWSMLHLKKNTVPATMQRPWMDVGLTMTGNSDLLYLGMMDRSLPAPAPALQTDMVMAWGCQDNATENDNFR